MSHTREVACDRCLGTGKIWDYRARDIVVGANEVPEHTYEVECPSCLGQGHVRINPEEGNKNVPE